MANVKDMMNVGHIVAFRVMISLILRKIFQMKKVLWRDQIIDLVSLVKSVIPQIPK